MKQTVFKSIVERLYDGFFNKEEEKNYIELEKQQIISALKAGINFEITKSEFKDTKLTYNEFFEQYYKENYE